MTPTTVLGMIIALAGAYLITPMLMVDNPKFAFVRNFLLSLGATFIGAGFIVIWIGGI